MNKAAEIKKPRPLDQGRGVTIHRFGINGVATVRDTGALFSVDVMTCASVSS